VLHPLTPDMPPLDALTKATPLLGALHFSEGRRNLRLQIGSVGARQQSALSLTSHRFDQKQEPHTLSIELETTDKAAMATICLSFQVCD
jgi:hypothetical protein